MSETLYLSLKSEYFDAIRDGFKIWEYRRRNEYWRKRIEGRQYERIVLTKGYPSRADKARHIEREWQGYTLDTIIHPNFGPEPVEVYAICVKENPHK